MFNEEVIHVVVEILAKSKEPLSFDDLLDEIPCDKAQIISAVSLLVRHGILIKKNVQEDDEVLYECNKMLTPYQINKAIEIGVNVSELEKVLEINSKQKKAAFLLSAQSQKLKELDEEQRKIREKLLAQNVQAPRNMIVDALERLAKASEQSIKGYVGDEQSEDAILKALEEAKRQALKALENYQEELSRGRGASVDDY